MFELIIGAVLWWLIWRKVKEHHKEKMCVLESIDKSLKQILERR